MIETIVSYFQRSKLTLLFILVSMMLGVVALVVTPKEEDPQISVNFVNIYIPFAGATAAEVEQIVSIPAEQELSKIVGIKHVYSVSQPGRAVITVRFKIGQRDEDAISRVYNAIYQNDDWLPQGMGVGKPLIKPKNIDDVPIVTLTLWTED